MEIEEILERAAEEIRSLRRANEVLAAKVDTMNLFALVLRTSPSYQGQGEGEDIAWRIDQVLSDLKANDKDFKEVGDGQGA